MKSDTLSDRVRRLAVAVEQKNNDLERLRAVLHAAQERAAQADRLARVHHDELAAARRSAAALPVVRADLAATREALREAKHELQVAREFAGDIAKLRSELDEQRRRTARTDLMLAEAHADIERLTRVPARARLHREPARSRSERHVDLQAP